MKKPESDGENKLSESGIKPGINVAELISATKRIKNDDILRGGIMRYNHLLNNAAAEEFGEALREAVGDQEHKEKIMMMRDLALQGREFLMQKKFKQAFDCFEQMESAGMPEGRMLKGSTLIMMNNDQYFNGIYLMASACFDSMENHFFENLRATLEAGCQSGLFRNPRKLMHNVNEAEMALQLNNFISAIDQEKNPKLAAAILLQNLRKFME